jgi:hypothetical protein
MTQLNYLAPAELYLGSDQSTALAQGPRPFSTAANAIRFAVEHAAPVSLRGAKLIVGDKTFTGADLPRLHSGAGYPLPRKH